MNVKGTKTKSVVMKLVMNSYVDDTRLELMGLLHPIMSCTESDGEM